MVPGNPNVQAVQMLLGDLEADLKNRRLIIRFDQPIGTSVAVRYDATNDEMHLQPPKDVDLAKRRATQAHDTKRQRHYGSLTRTTTLPKFLPASRSINACGARSSPSMNSSRSVTLPSATHALMSRTKSAYPVA